MPFPSVAVVRGRMPDVQAFLTRAFEGPASPWVTPGVLACVGLVLLVLYALPALVDRRSDWSSPVEPQSLELQGVELGSDGALRGVASEGDLHIIAAPVALRRDRDYQIRFDVVRPAPGRVELFTALYADGYDRGRQRRVLNIDTGSTGTRIRLTINSGKAAPAHAYLRVLYSGAPGLTLANLHFREISRWRTALGTFVYGSALAALVLAAVLAIVRAALPTASISKPAGAQEAQPIGTLLALYFAVTFGHFALYLFTPYWSGDEARYRGIAAALWQLNRQAPVDAHMFYMPMEMPNALYPYLISPAFAAGFDFYTVVRLMNACAMSLVVFPTYWIGRRYLTRSAALFVAALAGTTPCINLGAYAVTEVPFFPAFVLAAWFTIESLCAKRPLPWTIGVGVMAAMLLIMRLNGVVVLPGFLVCTLWMAFRCGTIADLWRRPVWLAAPIAFVPTYLAVHWLAGVDSVGTMGIYTGWFTVWNDIWQYLQTHIPGAIDLALGHLTTLSMPFALPLALLVVSVASSLWQRGSPLSPERAREEALHVVAAVFFVALFVLCIVFTMAVMPVELGGINRWHSRYYFHAFPLLMLSFAAHLAAERRASSTWAVRSVWGVVAILLVANWIFLDFREGSKSVWWGGLVDNMDVQWYDLRSLRKFRWPLLGATLILTLLWNRDSRWLRPATCVSAVFAFGLMNFGTVKTMGIGQPVSDPCGRLAASFMSLQTGTFAVVGSSREFWTGASFWSPYLPQFTQPLEMAPLYTTPPLDNAPDFVVTDADHPPDSRYRLRVESERCRIYGRV